MAVCANHSKIIHKIYGERKTASKNKIDTRRGHATGSENRNSRKRRLLVPLETFQCCFPEIRGIAHGKNVTQIMAEIKPPSV